MQKTAAIIVEASRLSLADDGKTYVVGDARPDMHERSHLKVRNAIPKEY
jgi:hypothetical protein